MNMMPFHDCTGLWNTARATPENPNPPSDVTATETVFRVAGTLVFHGYGSTGAGQGYGIHGVLDEVKRSLSGVWHDSPVFITPPGVHPRQSRQIPAANLGNYTGLFVWYFAKDFMTFKGFRSEVRNPHEWRAWNGTRVGQVEQISLNVIPGDIPQQQIPLLKPGVRTDPPEAFHFTP